MTCQEIRESAAVALLTREPFEDSVTDHLKTCPACQREIDDLLPVVNLLEVGPPLVAGEEPSDLLLRRLLAASRRERRRRRYVAAIAGAAALALLVPTAGWIVEHRTGPTQVTSPTTVLQASATDASTGVHGTARLTPSAAGSELAMSVNGVSSGTRCKLVVIDRSGRRHLVDTWTATYRGTADVTTQSPVPVSQVGHIELIDAGTETVLLHLNFT